MNVRSLCRYSVFLCLSFMINGAMTIIETKAQDVEDLFGDSDSDVQVDEQEDKVPPINPFERRSLFRSLDDTDMPTSPSDMKVRSFQRSPSTQPRTGMSAAELRQARALYRSRQRIARLENNLWMGYEPLRPQWNSVPMMSSRYSSRRTIYVPVYVRN